MKLHNGNLLWKITAENDIEIKRKNIASHYDVIIVGGGISGSLSAFSLANEGLKVAIIDKGKMGYGSTLANTGLLHYTNDIMLQDLIDNIGEAKAVRFYRMCQKAIGQLEAIASKLPYSSDFIRRKTLYFATDESDVEKLKNEYETLTKYGFSAEPWSRNDIENHFPFSKSFAIVTNGDAEINPYKFDQGIIHYLNNSGVDLFEHVNVLEAKETATHLDVRSTIGKFHTDHLIFATGYGKPPLLSGNWSNPTHTYVMATEPIADLSFWHERNLIWETKRPYLYLRTTADNRILAGGMDEVPLQSHQSEEWIYGRANHLKLELEKLFPMLDIKVAFAWGALFCQSADGLPFIGKHPKKERVYYMLGYGGNGTVYSMLGANILRDLILNRPNSDAEIVKLNR